MSYQLEQAISAYQAVQKAEREFAKANRELNRTLIHLPDSEIDEYYKITTALCDYQKRMYRKYP